MSTKEAMKKSGKGTASGDEKKKEEEMKILTDAEIGIYKVQIEDFERRQERMSVRCEEMEKSIETYQLKYKELNEDTKNTIDYLKSTLEQKKVKIDELVASRDEHRKKIREETKKYREEIVNIEHEYKLSHEQQITEVKILTGKLNSLEDFRMQKEALINQLKSQDKQMEEQVYELKNQLFEIERKFVIGKDHLKKDMEYKLLELANMFQNTVAIRISETSHRLFRENIALQKNLNILMRESEKTTIENIKLERILGEQKHHIDMYKNEIRFRNMKCLAQRKLIGALSKEHKTMKLKYDTVRKQAALKKIAEEEMKQSRKMLSDVDNDIKIIQQKLDAIKHIETERVLEMMALRNYAATIYKTVCVASQIIREASKHSKVLEGEPNKHAKLEYQKTILLELLEILSAIEIPQSSESEEETKLSSITSFTEKHLVEDVNIVQQLGSVELLHKSISAVIDDKASVEESNDIEMDLKEEISADESEITEEIGTSNEENSVDESNVMEEHHEPE